MESRELWISYHERYCYLNEKLSDRRSKEKLTISCLIPISNMWRWYASLPKQDKEAAKKQLQR